MGIMIDKRWLVDDEYPQGFGAEKGALMLYPHSLFHGEPELRVTNKSEAFPSKSLWLPSTNQTWQWTMYQFYYIYIYSHFVNYRWFSHSNHDRFQGLPLFANPGVPKQRRHPPPTPPQEFRAALQGAALRGSACRACTRFVQQKAGFGRNIVIPMDIHGIILG